MTQPLPIALTPIGRIRTGFKTLAECPARGRSNPAESILEIDAGFAEGLLNIGMATHAIVLYWLDRADRTALHRRTRRGEVVRGVFASRTPRRPNPVAFSVVRIHGLEGNLLRVSGLDCLDGTAIIDIKPYVPEDDCVPEAHIGWECGCAVAPIAASQSQEVGKC